MLNVHHVDIHVPLVLMNSNVSFVVKTESILQLVIVQITSITPPTNVKNVLTNVLTVLVLVSLVILVLLTESTNLLVIVHLDSMMFRVKLGVNLVLHNVSLVPVLLIIVKSVPKTDFLNHYVDAHQIT
jgi:hypothetical protein